MAWQGGVWRGKEDVLESSELARGGGSPGGASPARPCARTARQGNYSIVRRCCVSDTAVNGATAASCEPARTCRCGRAINPEHGRHYCSDRCRLLAWAERQQKLEFVPALQPLTRLNPTAPKNRRRQLQQKCLNILGRLQLGPATAQELHEIGGWRFSARIDELRAAGHYIVGPKLAPRRGILDARKPGPDGVDIYELWK